MSLSGQPLTVFCTSCRGAAQGSCGLYTAQMSTDHTIYEHTHTLLHFRNNINEDVIPSLLVLVRWFTVQGAFFFFFLYLAILKLTSLLAEPLSILGFFYCGSHTTHLRNQGCNYSCRKHNMKEKKPCSAEYCF